MVFTGLVLRSVTKHFTFSFLSSAAQDAGLDVLAAVISRQKMMGQEIGNELDEQNGKVCTVCTVCLNKARWIMRAIVRAIIVPCSAQK